jgi:diacylglycerol kinase
MSGVQWRSKFSYAFTGLNHSFRTQSSFWVHLPAAIIVIVVAAVLHLESWRWCVLLLTIAVVIAAELFNTALEQLVVVLHPTRDPRIARSLDAAAAAVLVIAIASVLIGVVVLGPPLLNLVR